MAKIILAAGPVIIENGRVLLNQHGEDDFWKFCGGTVEDGESNLREAAAREAKEEMGIDLEFLSDSPYFFYTEKGEEKTSVVLAHFLAKRLGEIKPGLDIRAWRFLSREELASEKLAPNILPVLKYFKFLE